MKAWPGKNQVPKTYRLWSTGGMGWLDRDRSLAERQAMVQGPAVMAWMGPEQDMERAVTEGRGAGAAATEA